MKKAPTYSVIYSTSYWTCEGYRRITDAAILAEFARIGDSANPSARAVEVIRAKGIRYSNEDFDTLGGALGVLQKVDPNVWARISVPEVRQ